MRVPKGERIRRMLLERAEAMRLKPVHPPTPPDPYEVRHGPEPATRRSYGKKKAKARKHRKEVARQHTKERKPCPAPSPPLSLPPPASSALSCS